MLTVLFKYIPARDANLTIYGFTFDSSSYQGNTVNITYDLALINTTSDDLTATVRVWSTNIKIVRPFGSIPRSFPLTSPVQSQHPQHFRTYQRRRAKSCCLRARRQPGLLRLWPLQLPRHALRAKRLSALRALANRWRNRLHLRPQCAGLVSQVRYPDHRRGMRDREWERGGE